MNENIEEKSVAASKDGHLTDSSRPCRPLANNNEKKKLLTVKEFCQEYQVARSVVYMLITQDPCFPVVNLGYKKKYFINVEEVESWAFKRAYREPFGNSKIPTLEKILNKAKEADDEQL